tara:strand:- start:762 stop:1730 length:969 start_codon:yes stop_codon:yes gene_type:complete
MVRPPSILKSGIMGHLWEQICLGLMVSPKELLLSPANTGPLFLKNQILVVHDVATLVHPEWFTGLFSLWYRWLLPKLIKRVQRIVTVSEFSKGEICRTVGVSPAKISVIHNGVDVTSLRFTYDSEVGKVMKDLLDKKYLLFVGSLEPRKNLTRLLEAWGRVNFEDISLFVCGGSVGRVFSEDQLCFSQKNVEFLGRVSDVDLAHLIGSACGFVYPSLYEGFGLPPLEALITGCPVLVSDIPVMKELFSSVGEEQPGIIFCNPHCVDSMVEGLVKLVGLSQDDRRSHILNGSNLAEKYSWQKSSSALWDIVENEYLVLQGVVI